MPESSLASRDLTLLDLVDSILQRGTVLSGDLTLAVADVDLVQVNLRALLASVDTVQRLSSRRGTAVPEAAATTARPTPSAQPRRSRRQPVLHGGHALRKPPAARIDTGPEDVERGLAQLVLTVIELIRQLMERQALYRLESDTLTPDQVERLGQTFLKLEQRMGQLKEQFGLVQEDLNLHLGPLGDLM